MKLFVTTLLATTLASGFAFAAGGSGNTGGAAAPAPAATAPAPKMPAPMMAHCKKGEVAMKKKGKMKCVKVKAELVPDKELYTQGWQLAKAGEYDWAIEVLSAVQDQNDPDVLNMLGYSNRKAGRIELGISYYDKALALKPDFVRAREYLGEGYVAAGKVDLAKAQLDEIQKICGTTCDEYKDLSKVIDASTL